MSLSVYAAIPVMAILTILQTAVLPHFPLAGLSPLLPFLVALAWTLLRGVDEGLLWAFVGGFFLDLFSLTPLGVTSLSWMVGILTVVWIERALPSSRVFLPMALSALATVTALLVSSILLSLVGQLPMLGAVAALLPLALLHAVAILPVYWLMLVVDRAIRPRRVQV